MALITFNCQTCGNLVSAYRSPSAKNPPRFCSLRCLGIAQKGQGNPAYSGGRHILANGYWVVHMPDHANADSRGYVYEHRLVAEEKIGRPLSEGEVVHHINHCRTDNNPENLEVLGSNSEHMKHHFRGLTPVYLRGEHHRMAKLMQTNVDEIRNRFSNGERQYILADEFCISRSQLSNIIRGKQWIKS